ncbi:DUF2637 domain-containing protein [Amycolatopsis australiensis]|uniref:Phage integrase family protein n=1 Tax=Amycolatopsis australiensis TaxID=546364 RepID=A0A1K1SRR0_9PSEU|nr:Protein of unknown function [Amycolatopsis australiensis]
MRLLVAHGNERGATHPDAQLLRYRTGEPITKRRYDHLWDRIGRQVSSVRTQNVSTHWLRHTTLTWVERRFGYGVAHAYAGHFDSADSATVTYVKASLQDVATALATLTGEPHPPCPQPCPWRCVVTRTDRWTAGLVIQCACTALVALGAAYASYRHGRVFAIRFGGDPTTASIWPLIVDGLLTIATVELWKAGHDTGRRIAWTAFGFGICLSLCANVGSTYDHTVFGVIVAASPPLSLLLAVELLNRSLRRRRVQVETDETNDVPTRDLVSGDTELTAEQRMWQYYLREHARGRVPTGAELDRVTNTSNYGRRISAPGRPPAGWIDRDDHLNVLV